MTGTTTRRAVSTPRVRTTISSCAPARAALAPGFFFARCDCPVCSCDYYYYARCFLCCCDCGTGCGCNYSGGKPCLLTDGRIARRRPRCYQPPACNSPAALDGQRGVTYMLKSCGITALLRTRLLWRCLLTQWVRCGPWVWLMYAQMARITCESLRMRVRVRISGMSVRSFVKKTVSFFFATATKPRGNVGRNATYTWVQFFLKKT